MPEITVLADAGRTTGSRAAGRLRAAGRIPAVLYGHGITPLPLSVDGRDLRGALNTDAGVNAVLNLVVGDARHLAMARVLQRDPVRHTVIHVDFQVVGRDEVMTAEVPINLVGRAEDLLRGGGVVNQEMFSLAIQATPARIPSHLEVDISALSAGETIRVRDVVLPPGVTTDADPDAPVVGGLTPHGPAPESEPGAAGEGSEG
ncbi:MAG: 50S ribosomal protein L25 [Acidimicrobiales bacterium]